MREEKNSHTKRAAALRAKADQKTAKAPTLAEAIAAGQAALKASGVPIRPRRRLPSHYTLVDLHRG